MQQSCLLLAQKQLRFIQEVARVGQWIVNLLNLLVNIKKSLPSWDQSMHSLWWNSYWQCGLWHCVLLTIARPCSQMNLWVNSNFIIDLYDTIVVLIIHSLQTGSLKPSPKPGANSPFSAAIWKKKLGSLFAGYIKLCLYASVHVAAISAPTIYVQLPPPPPHWLVQRTC